MYKHVSPYQEVKFILHIFEEPADHGRKVYHMCWLVSLKQSSGG